MSELKNISVQQLGQHSQAGQVDVIDVRTPVEFREVHAKVARNIPLDSLDPHALMAQRNGRANDPLYVICDRGNRSTQACQQFHKAGFTNVVNVEGGTQAWEEASLPVVRGKKAVSLERQVRMAAGSLVLVGSALAFFVHPYFIGLAAFVGAGLLFAGITDTCGMGLMLAKMPWNQIRDDKTTCCAGSSADVSKTTTSATNENEQCQPVKSST